MENGQGQIIVTRKSIALLPLSAVWTGTRSVSLRCHRCAKQVVVGAVRSCRNSHSFQSLISKQDFHSRFKSLNVRVYDSFSTTRPLSSIKERRRMFRRSRAILGSTATTTTPTSSSLQTQTAAVVATRESQSGRYCTTSNAIATALLLYIVLWQHMELFVHQMPQQTSSNVNCPTASVKAVGVWPRRQPPPIVPSAVVEWKPFSATLIALPYPIFVTSLPKSGTTSIWKFFKCGQVLASHNWIKKKQSDRPTPVGMCIQANILAGRPPFHECGDVDVYTDTGVSISRRSSAMAVAASNVATWWLPDQPFRSRWHSPFAST
jgi:hypothetical protein